MKIALIIRRLNVKGGTQRQALSLMAELRKRGHQIKIYTFQLSKADCYPELLEGYEIFDGKGLGAKALALKMDKDFDILNPHDPGAERVAYYYKKYVKNIPAIWNMNDTDSKVWSFDKMRGVDESFKKPLSKRIYYWLYDKVNSFRYLRQMDAIVVVDDFNRVLTKKYLGLSAITVRNGPDHEHFVYRERTAPGKKSDFQGKSDFKEGAVRLLTSGILLTHRRFEDSIEAVKILKDNNYEATLTIIGDTDNDKKYYAKLIDLVKKLNVEDRIFFLGKISETKLLEAYSTHDIYIFQHHLQSDGLSPFEAAASGLPIIVSKTAGSHEVLTDGENALFIEPKNPGDIAEKVKRLVDDPELYRKFSRDGNTFVRQNFSWQKYTDDVLKVFVTKK